MIPLLHRKIGCDFRRFNSIASASLVPAATRVVSGCLSLLIVLQSVCAETSAKISILRPCVVERVGGGGVVLRVLVAVLTVLAGVLLHVASHAERHVDAAVATPIHAAAQVVEVAAAVPLCQVE